MEKLYFGAAYYEEYLPYDRLEEDVEMMKKAGINIVRIAESTWSTCEPQPGVFDFSHVNRVLDAMEKAGISVIIGTPTYAVPAWLAKMHPDVLAVTKTGRGIYGPRQIMDITNPSYLFYAERVIRKLMEQTAQRKCVAGFQLDNETKYYGTSGENVQQGFVTYLKEKFQNDLEKMNHAFGLDYWSNRINTWEEFPDVRGTINGSLGAEFAKYQRTLVTAFLSWQAEIVSQYKREDQFLTQNFDFEWRGYSYGIQPYVDVTKAAQKLTMAGVDIYHPAQSMLTGAEIAFGGDVARSIKKENYFVLETQAQGFPGWLPYPGQLLLQAYSHIAGGASSVMYWHWHSLHNAVETYWKGLLSHDFRENETYLEAQKIGKEWEHIGNRLLNLKKKNKVAVMVSNTALTALEWFPIDADPASPGSVKYNDILRWIYDALYRCNIECDIIWTEEENLSDYQLIIVPALYAVDEACLEQLDRYTQDGGHLFVTFKSAFADENVKVYADIQPHLLCKALGISYNQFTVPRETGLESRVFHVEEAKAQLFMELVKTDTAETLIAYEKGYYEKYSALSRNDYGKGTATYLSCKVEDKLLEEILVQTAEEAGIQIREEAFPIIVRRAVAKTGKEITFYLNFSGERQFFYNHDIERRELRTDAPVKAEERIVLEPWDVKIME